MCDDGAGAARVVLTRVLQRRSLGGGVALAAVAGKVSGGTALFVLIAYAQVMNEIEREPDAE